MSYILIDNSTLTSVQRLTGDIEVSNKNVIESDILATENLIQAILFHDEIISIDDYKEEYKETRKEKFNFIRFLNPKKFNLEQIYIDSKKEAESYKPEIRGGQFTDENFREILELLKLNMITTWDISSSEYYLNLKLLGHKYDDDYDKYNQVSSAIFDDFFYNQTGKRDYGCRLLDSSGKIVEKGYKVPNAKWSNGGSTGDKLLTGQLWSFIASLNWISYKSILYTNIARHLQADLFLHPVRQSFNIHHMKKTQNFDLNFVSDLLNQMKTESLDDIELIQKSMHPTIESIQLPYFSFWLVKETNDPRHIIEKAYDIRSRQVFIDSREQLAELNNLIHDESSIQKFAKKSKKLKEHIERNIHSIKSNYGLGSAQGIQFNSLVKVTNSLFNTSFPDVFDNKEIKLPKFMKKKPKGLSLIYRDITEDLSKISRYGKYRDLLSSKVNLREEHDGRFDLSLNCEAPEYMRAHSGYKSPM